MNRVKIELIIQAISKYKRIFPCANKSTLFECFTEIDNNLLFWFNTEDHSTHLLTAEIESSI